MPCEMPHLVTWKLLFPREILRGTTRVHVCKCEVIIEQYCTQLLSINVTQQFCAVISSQPSELTWPWIKIFHFWYFLFLWFSVIMLIKWCLWNTQFAIFYTLRDIPFTQQWDRRYCIVSSFTDISSGCGCNVGCFKPFRACKTADTCTQLVDCLQHFNNCDSHT